MAQNLEENVRKETKRRGNAWKGLLIGLASGAVIGAGTGAQYELKHHALYEHGVKREIKNAALEGYAWKEEADPTFYRYEQPVLVLNEKDMTMQGHMIKAEGADTIDAGPIRKGGSIGYPLPEKLKKEVKEDIDGLKGRMRDLGENIKEGYQRTDSAVTRQFRKWFKKDTTQYKEKGK